jgi:metal-responsive CopG/Arc/MetJ family transcriptional regulator
MAKAVQISLDEELLRQIDADPETKRRGRSAVVQSALLLYLDTQKRRAVDAEILRAYGGAGAHDAPLEIEPFIEAQAWPKK